MPLQNRVQPTSDILAVPVRGQFMGNRGILHTDDRQLTHVRWRRQAWVCCLTDFKNRKRPLMAPRHYTELFFFDEPVALAAGHRPCGECRRAAYKAFLEAANHAGPIAIFDQKLHQARAVPRTFGQRRAIRHFDDLPDGTFVQMDTGQPALIWQDALFPYQPSGYLPPLTRPKSGETRVLTPGPSLIALREGYQVSPRIAET